jgi:hypothetical protein
MGAVHDDQIKSFLCSQKAYLRHSWFTVIFIFQGWHWFVALDDCETRWGVQEERDREDQATQMPSVDSILG